MLTKTSIKKPFTVIVMIIVIAIVGGVAVAKMPLDLFPEMDLPYMIVATMVPGGAPEEVEKKVTGPMEENMRQINNVKEVTSISADNVSAVIMELHSGADLTTITQDIDTKIKAIKSSFPSMTMEPIIMKIDPDMMPIMTIAISKTGQTIEASSVELSEISDKIKSVSGVASVSNTGSIESNVFMQINPERLLNEPTNILVNHISAYLNNDKNPMPKELEDFLNQKDENGKLVYGEIVTGLKLIKSNPTQAVALMESLLGKIDLSTIMGDIPELDGIKSGITNMLGTMITPDLVNSILIANNFEMPAGTVPVNGSDFFVKVGEKVKSYSELEHLPAFSMDLRGIREAELNNPNIDKNSPEYLSSPTMADKISSMLGAKFPKTLANKVALDNVVINLVGPEPPTEAEKVEYNKRKAMVTNLVSGLLYNKDTEGEGYTRSASYNYLVGLFYQPLTIELRDVMYMFNTNTASKAHTIINGADGMMLSIYKTPDASVTDVTNGIEAMLKDMHKADESINYIILSNQGQVTKFMISSIAQNLLLGALFAIIVLLIFLRDWKPTVTVGMSIIVSLVTAFAVMYLCGVTLNLVSMGGLALSVGMLVDNSIVVIENIYRKRNEGVSPIKAAYEGTKQVSGAILSSTITTVIVFLPVIFVEGITKQIFLDLAITIAVSLFASLIVAITFVPMISSRMLGVNRAAKKESKAFIKLKQGYSKALNFMLNRKWITLVVVTVLFVASIISAFFMDVEFMPDTSMQQITVSIGIDKSKLGNDYAYDEIVDDVIKDMNRQLEDKPYIKDKGIELSAGMTVMGFTMGGGNITSYITVDKKSKVKPEQAQKELNEIANNIAGDAKYPESAIVVGGIKNTGGVDVAGMVNSYLDASLLSINVYGQDIDEMRAAALDLEKRFKEIGEDVYVNNGLVNSTKEFKLIVDTEAASKYNLTTAQIFLQYFGGTVPPTANTNINFVNDIGSSSIYIYTADNNMDRWYRAADADGNLVRLYFNKSDNTATATRFETRVYNKDRKIVETISYDLNKKTGVFTSDTKKTYNPETGAVIDTVNVKGNYTYTADVSDMPVYYDTSKVNDVDMVTFMLSIPKFGEMPSDMAMPMAGDYEGETEQVKNLPIFMLLDDASFARGSDGKIIYRKANDERFKKMLELGGGNVYYADSEGYIRYNYNGAVDHSGLDTNPRVPESINMVFGFNTITHAEGKRVVQMGLKSASLNNNQLGAKAKTIIDEFNKAHEGTNIKVEFVGQNKMISETFNSLFLMIGLAIVFIYLVMVAQFQSLKSPFIIMFTIPLALTGSILTLLMAGMPISVFALVGIILLVGIVVNNGIVFIDYVNKLMQTGMHKREALLRAAQDRIRPILMTALTTICSMLISVFDTSMGASAIKPMAVTVVGGLTYATLLTLFFVPILYDLMNRKDKVAVIKFDDDKEDDIEAEMRLSKLNDVKEVLQESETLQMMDETFIANNMRAATPMEEYINENTTGDKDVPADMIVEHKKEKRKNKKRQKGEMFIDSDAGDMDNSLAPDEPKSDAIVSDEVTAEDAKTDSNADGNADDTKVEEAKTEEVKVDGNADEVKAEEPKVEDAKADDTKADDAIIADEPKAEKPKKPATKKSTSAKKTTTGAKKTTTTKKSTTKKATTKEAETKEDVKVDEVTAEDTPSVDQDK